MNKHLINASRYLDAVHDISVDENHPMLDKLIRKQVLKVESETLATYWNAYLKDITVDADIEPEDSVANDNAAEPDQKQEKTTYYRGVAQVDTEQVSSDTDTDKKKAINYRGAAKVTPSKEKKGKAVYYRGSKVE